MLNLVVFLEGSLKEELSRRDHLIIILVQTYVCMRCSDAMLNLGMFLEGGMKGLEGETALSWYTRAMEAGNEKGKYHVARCHAQGVGLKSDFHKAAGVLGKSVWELGDKKGSECSGSEMGKENRGKDDSIQQRVGGNILRFHSKLPQPLRDVDSGTALKKEYAIQSLREVGRMSI